MTDRMRYLFRNCDRHVFYLDEPCPGCKIEILSEESARFHEAAVWLASRYCKEHADEIDGADRPEVCDLCAREKAERERDEVLALVREWLCEKCNTVFPGPPQPGASCLICPKCGGTTTPRPLAEKRIAERERDEAFDVLGLAGVDEPLSLPDAARQRMRELAEARKALVWTWEHLKLLDCAVEPWVQVELRKADAGTRGEVKE